MVDSIQSLMSTLVNDVVWTVFSAIVIVLFIRSAILFLSSSGEPANITKAKASFVWGVVGVVVGIVAYSIVALVKKTLGA